MDDLLGVGILGAGWITRAHGLAIRTLPVRWRRSAGRSAITMLAARDRERGEAMAAQLEVERFTTDWREVVEDPSVDVVANLMGVAGAPRGDGGGTGPRQAGALREAPRRGPVEARSMARGRRAAGVQAVTGFNYRYMPAMRLAQDIALSGALGDDRPLPRGAYLQDYAAARRPSGPTTGRGR